MNKNKLTKLRDYLQSLHTLGYEDRFDMNDYFSVHIGISCIGESIKETERCNTACCIAGHTVVLFKDELSENQLTSFEGNAYTVAMAVLELHPYHANDLFTPDDMNWSDISLNDAVNAINSLLETGEVRWKV